MDELETQITDEVAAVTAYLEQQLGRRSRWNGEVELTEDQRTFGKALWNGGICLDRQTAQADLRWRTQIHEALHHFSAGLALNAYLDLPGWEEGVVEQLQRLLRSALLNSLSVRLQLTVFSGIEEKHQYNRYIEALETMRHALSLPPQAFYEDLLATPLADRPASLMRAGRSLPTQEFRAFQRTFASAFSVLRGN